MAIVEPARFILTMQKNAALFQMLLRDVDQTRATSKRDGGDGWNVLEIMCHLRDYEQVFSDRARLMVEQDEPSVQDYNHELWVIENNYAGQNFNEVISEFLVRRGKFLSWINQRSPEDWARACQHPRHGRVTLLDQIIQASTHDVNHMEQAIRVLNS